MKKKEPWFLIIKSEIKIVIISLVVVILLASLLCWVQTSSLEHRCDRWSDNGFITVFEGDIFEGYHCNVKLEDGRYISIHDLTGMFNIEPAKK